VIEENEYDVGGTQSRDSTYDDQAEGAVLASVLKNPRAIHEVVDRLTPEAFHEIRNRVVFG
jgi:replicative DNA helicase